MESTINETEIWQDCHPAVGEWQGTEEIYGCLINGDLGTVGHLCHQRLVKAMSDLQNPPSSVYCLSKAGTAQVIVNQDSHPKRMLASRMAGRWFASVIEDDPICIVQSFPAWIGSDKSEEGITPTDDPHRTEAAVTIITDLRGLVKAQNLDEYCQALKKDFSWIWQHQMREGAVLKEEFMHTEVRPTKPEEPTEDDPKVVQLQNYGLNEIIVGLSPKFKLITEISNDPVQAQELDEKVKQMEESSTQE